MVRVYCRAKDCTTELGQLCARVSVRQPGDPVGVFIPSRALPDGADPAPAEFVVPSDYSGQVGVSVCPRHFRDESNAGAVAVGQELSNAKLQKAIKQAAAFSGPGGSITVAHHLRASLDCEQLRAAVQTFYASGRPSALEI